MVLFGIAVFAVGCDDEESPPHVNEAVYASPTAPESLIANLQVAYRYREIEPYAKILAPEFRFQFQPVDQSTIGKEFWNRDEDSVGTQALLESPLVSEIRISVLYSGRDTIWNSPGTPLDTLKIRIHTTDLQVYQTDDITWVATDEQDMFFRLGKPENGEDPTHWFMFEWHDLPSLSSPRPTGAGPITTWGSLKSRYGN